MITIILVSILSFGVGLWTQDGRVKDCRSGMCPAQAAKAPSVDREKSGALVIKCQDAAP